MNTKLEDINNEFENLKELFSKNKLPSYSQRSIVLKKLKSSLLENEKKLYSALSEDYGYRSEFDSMIADFMPTISAINYSIKKTKRWMRPQKRESGLIFFPSQTKIIYQPLGVVGVIVPWNFPLFLCLGPVIAALSAGNKVMVKLSEFTPCTNAVMKEVFSVLKDDVFVVEGAKEVSSYFASLPFDHLLFTGSTMVGKLIAKAAAENLTPITLELGGKSPCIIVDDQNLNNTINSILLGKCLNAGQICVAPDYVLIPKEFEQKFIQKFIQSYKSFYQQGDLYAQTHIVNDKQFSRLINYLEDAKSKGAELLYCDEVEPSSRKMAPIILTGVSDDMLVMQEEIFGPLLPVMTYKDISEAIDYVNSKSKPLSLYIMGNNSNLRDKIISQTHSGGVAINDTVVQVGVEDAPFGGIGESGSGQYHGIEGFQTFSKARTIFKTPSWLPRNIVLLKFRGKVFQLIRKFIVK